MPHRSTLIAVLTLLTVACVNTRTPMISRRGSRASPASQASTPNRDVSFSVIAIRRIPGIRRSLDVRLNRKVSKDALSAIARDLRSRDSAQYERTFIAYYLPGMKVGSGAWATTHFKPDLEVKILGLSVEEEQELVAEPAPATRQIIGRWLDESPYVGGRITIFRERGKIFIEQRFKDGSVLNEELVERADRLGRWFDKAERSGHGDHWILHSNGDLLVRDREGTIATAKKLR